MTIDAELSDAGFELIQQTRTGARKYALRKNPFLMMWVIVNNGTAELQWEFELGAYLVSKGFHVSVQDELSLLLFPKTESRGPADAAWVADEIARTEALLGSVDLTSGM